MATGDPSRKRFQPEGEVGPDTFSPEPIAPRTKGRYGRQNVLVLAAQVAGWALLLTAIQASASPPLTALLVLVFCALMQGVFSLMHEFFHDNAHPDARINHAIGVVGSTLFGTSATFHRVHHWGHHVRNRTVSEQGEFIHDGESRAGKIALYYFAVGGGLWLSGLVFPAVSFFIPYRAAEWIARFRRFNTYSAAFQQFKPADWTRMRLEAAGLFAFWALLLTVGPWRWQVLALAYGAFAFSWSSLQWVYHLRTPLHVVEGAYNLRLPAPIRWLFLNFNYNLTHHRRPYLPWQELYAESNQRETQPLWYRWLLMAEWPVPFPDDLGPYEKRYF
jgi:fatty acid desaturase